MPEERTIQYGKNYSKKEYILRILWGFAYPFFRYSPRLFYGWRNTILRVFGAKIGNGVKIYPSAKITFPWKLEIGKKSVISWEVIVYNLGSIKIGEECIISQYVHLCAGTHDYKSPGFELIKSSITIGDHVWIAADAFISPDISIGNNAVVGARSVVVKNVPKNTIVAGHPATQL